MQKQIDNIMDNFDFSRVLKVMQTLDWVWSIPFEGSRVPDERDLRKTARYLLNEVAKTKAEDYYVATGGFVAIKRCGDLSLEFVVSRWDYIGEDPDGF